MVRRALAFASLGGIAVGLFATAMQAGAEGWYRVAVVAAGLGLVGVWMLGRQSSRESVAIAVAQAVATATATAEAQATAQALAQVQVFIDSRRGALGVESGGVDTVTAREVHAVEAGPRVDLMDVPLITALRRQAVKEGEPVSPDA